MIYMQNDFADMSVYLVMICTSVPTTVYGLPLGFYYNLVHRQ